jgi:NADH-ubiquinone oxidoreductase chain 6
MNVLHILNSDNYINGYKVEILDFLLLISVLCAILVILSNNPIISVLYLIGLFLSVSCYLIILGLNFIGLSYLLVYVGAVSILFLFILMLINVRISELLNNTSNSLPLAMLLTISFYYSVYEILPPSFSISYVSIIYIYYFINTDYINNIIKIIKLFSKKGTIVFVTSKT